MSFNPSTLGSDQHETSLYTKLSINHYKYFPKSCQYCFVQLTTNYMCNLLHEHN